MVNRRQPYKSVPDTGDPAAILAKLKRGSYPTLTELGLAVGDFVIWCGPRLCLGQDMGTQRIRGYVLDDNSDIACGSAKERFVDLRTDDGRLLAVSTQYLAADPRPKKLRAYEPIRVVPEMASTAPISYEKAAAAERQRLYDRINEQERQGRTKTLSASAGPDETVR